MILKQLRMLECGYSTKMAAPFVTAVRAALRGVPLFQHQGVLTWRSQTPAVCQSLQLQAARCRLLHVSSAASMCSSRTEPQRNTQPHVTVNTQPSDKRAEEEEEDREPAEYIPRRRAKNPMWKIGYAWMIGLPTGIIGFILAKREVDKNRLKQLRIRQRMKRSNEGEYEGSRYRPHQGEDAKTDR